MAKKKAAPTNKKTGPAKKSVPAKKAAAPKKAAVKKAPAQGKPVRPAPAKKAVPAKKAPVKKVVKKAAPAKAKAPAKPAPKAKAAPKKAPTPKKAAPAKATVKAKPPVKVAPEKPAAPVRPAAKAEKPAPKAPAPKPAPTKVPEAPKAAAKTVAEKPAPAKAVAAKPAKPAKVKMPIIAVMTGIDPLGGPVRQLKRALKERFQLEFYLRATPGSLYDLLSTPSGLSEWFCNDVNVRGDEFTFVWGNDSQVAQCLSRKYGELIRFRWEDDDDPGAFFELRIRIDPMTNETCLVVTDHAWPQDMEEAKALWGSQIHTLARVLGA